MKKLFFFVAFFGLVAFNVNAQTCNKSAKTAKTVSADELPTCCVAAAAKLASMDDSIESKKCATSGKVTYFQKSTCPASGKVTSTEVKYCTKDKKFVNVSPSNKSAAVGGKNVKKAAVAKKVSATAKKSCDPAACAKSGKTCSKTAKTVSAKTVSAKKSCNPAACAKAGKTCSKSAKASNAKLVKATAEEN